MAGDGSFKLHDGALVNPPAVRLRWLAPPLLVLGGAGLLLTLVTDWRNRGRRAAVPAADSYLERVRRELAASGDE